ncbi:MAG: diaminopropionate ammonia-lyase [Acidobacteriota bacterium]
MRAFFHDRPSLAPTPTVALPDLAQTLEIGAVAAKDESARFGLNAFKLLGVRFAIETLLREGTLRAGQTVVCASEGNHGRAVARAAAEAGCASRVYMARDAAHARVEAIAGEGADVIRVDGSYDDAVRLLQDEAAAHGWTIISDTSWPGYERIPFLIMLGYTRMMDEVDLPFDAVFVQGGVGGLLGAIASWCAFHHPECKVIGVEPTEAACLQASARAGTPVVVEGPLNTAMAGLRNREVSPLAFASVKSTVDVFMAIDDRWTFDAMRTLHDININAGASGAAALGGLLALTRDPAMTDARHALGLGAASNALVIVSEGVTDPAVWRSVVGHQ